MKALMSVRVLLGSMFSALILSAILSFPAMAEGDEPPSDPVPTAESDHAGEPLTEEGEEVQTMETVPAIVDNPGGTGESGTAGGTESQDEIGPAGDSGDTPLLPAEIPTDMGLIVVAEDGTPLPLASEEAAELIEVIDPRWCPVGVTPGGASCTAPYTSLWLLIKAIADGDIPEPSTNGVIWIQAGEDQSNFDIVMDGNAAHFTNWAKYQLTLKGGWSGGNNTSINISNPSVFDQSISILNWGNYVGLSDITFDGGGLEISTTGKVTLTRVHVKNGSGAEIDNDAGIQDVVITSSEFSDNTGAGLTVFSKGAITLNNVSAINNAGDGANLNNAGGVAKAVTLNGTNIFAENEGSGLVIRSKGAITINNLIANANGAYGADLANDTASTAQPVYLKYSNEFKYNGSTGLLINSVGTVTLTKITAIHNSGDGTLIDNTGPFYANVTINGVNQFSYNGTDGLVVSSSGNITLYNVSATNNGLGGVCGSGAILDNSSVAFPKSVVLKGANTFGLNLDDGLVIDSYGAITINNLIASGIENGSGALLNNRIQATNQQNVTLTGLTVADDNGGFGLQISSFGNVSIGKLAASRNGETGLEIVNDAGIYPRNVLLAGGAMLNENSGTGLDVTSAGAITVTSLLANGNGLAGASLDNSPGKAPVTIKGINGFSGNLGGRGLEVSSQGNITLYNFVASDNSGDGVYLNNGFSGATGNVSIVTSVAKWCNEANWNAGSGISIKSNGAVAASNLCAEGNGSIATPGYGALIDNHNALGIKSVTLTGGNSFTQNYTGGIKILSAGAMKLTNITASQSIKGPGAEFNNTHSGVISPQLISISGTNSFSANYGNGLTILSYGAISASNLNASSNGANDGSGYGARIDNCGAVEGACTAQLARTVTLTGQNSFNLNSEYGLTLNSLGAITVNKVRAQLNDESGAEIKNDFPGATAGITIVGFAIFNENEVNGLEIASRGFVSLANLQASENGAFGATVSNLNSPFSKGITLLGANVFEGNNDYGLLIDSLGPIMGSNLAASHNGGYGVRLDNATGIGAIALTGAQKFQQNQSNGVEIYSKRAVTINNLTSSLNLQYGALIDNSAFGLPYDVKLTGTNSLNGNGESGLELTTLGAIYVSNLTASANGQDVEAESGYGAYLDNQTGASIAKPITIAGINTFSDNRLDGLRVVSLGMIKANSLTANWNKGIGVSLNNEPGSSSAGVYITGSNYFAGNTGTGLEVDSKGVIVLANLTAEANLGGGVKIDNSTSDASNGVAITGTSNFNFNGTAEAEGSGLVVASRGKITLNNVMANENYGKGVFLNNMGFAIGSPGVTLTGVNTFSGNSVTGLFILSAGDVSLNNVAADGNTGDGVYVASLKNVTLTCASITTNDGTGLFISALVGKVTLKGVFAYGNDYENRHISAGDFVEARNC